ncbi:MAG: D-arabinono-1,4-lactone oxidase, partial [Mycobacteriaceae bacterium]
QVLPCAVAEVELVRADGELVTVRRGDPGFEGSVIALGCLGVVTHLTLDLVPTFSLRQVVRTGLTRDALHTHLGDILDSAYSVSVFTDHRADSTAQVWSKQAQDTDPVADWFGTVPAAGPLHPVPGEDPAAATTQGGIVGPWHERLPHFRLEHTPSSGEELQSEYFVAREHALAALAAAESLAHEMAPLLLVSELRTVAADELWLSPAYRRDCVVLHFTWRREPAAVRALLSKLEALLDGLEARPHWGKVNAMDPAVVRGLFPRLPDARALVHAGDPGGKLRNDWVAAYLG